MKHCRHCGKASVCRPRRLCWVCYYRLDIRGLYPSESKYGQWGVADFYGPVRLPMPTSTTPGTPEKIAILTQRAQARQALFHPLDTKLAGPVGTFELAEVG